MKDLAPALPEGTVRKRDRQLPNSASSLTEDQSVRVRISDLRNSREVLRQDRVMQEEKYFDEQIKLVHIWGDGATRGNGTSSPQSAMGVYCGDYRCPYNIGKIIDEPTNNRAELRAFISALMVATQIKVLHDWIRNFTFHFDSTYVVTGTLEGRMDLPFDSGHANSDLWFIAGEVSKQLSDCHFQTVWVPRSKNRAADELANAALDKRIVNTDIHNELMGASYSSDLLIQAFTKVTSKRFSTVRHIPQGLEVLFVQVIESISTRQIPFEERRMMFTLLPHLISVYAHHVSSSQSYKHLRTHLSMLANEDYFAEHLTQIAHGRNDYNFSQPKDQGVSSQRIISLCRIGAFHKCIANDAIQIESQPSQEIINKLTDTAFHTKPLPMPLHITTAVTTTYGEIFRAYRRLKSHKGAGLSGWTKELLWHPLNATHLKVFMVRVLTSIINDQLHEVERAMYKTSIAMIIKYVDCDKRRLCLISDTLLKWGFHIVLRGRMSQDSNFQLSSNTFGMSGQCQIVIHAVQHVIDKGTVPIQMDSVSAFPTVSRTAIFDYLQSRSGIYSDAFPLINLVYSSPSFAKLYFQGSPIHTFMSTTGSHQGCVSGPALYAFGTIRANLKVGPGIAQMADDFYTIVESPQLFPKVIEEFKKSDQVLDGPKMRTLNRQVLPVTALGGILVHPSNPDNIIRLAIQKVCNKVTKTYNAIRNLDAPLQCKLLILRSAQWNYTYYLETWHPKAGEALAQHLESTQIATFFHLFPTLNQALHDCQDHTRNILLHLPTEDGGVGLIPFTDMQPYFYYKSRQKARPHILSKFGMDIGEPPSINVNMSAVGKWHQIFQERMTASRVHYSTLEGRMFCTQSDFQSWLDTWPVNKWMQINDEELTLAMFMRFNLLPETNLRCTSAGFIDRLKPDQRYLHFVGCRHCSGGTIEGIRHNSTVEMLHRTFKYHSTYSKPMHPKDMPISSSQPRSATDLLVITNRIFHIDLVVSAASVISEEPSRSGRRMNAAFRRKIQRYRAFEKNSGITTLPWVMSNTAVIHHKTLELMKDLITHAVSPTQLRKDLIANSQMELIRSTYKALQVAVVLRKDVPENVPSEDLTPNRTPSNVPPETPNRSSGSKRGRRNNALESIPIVEFAGFDDEDVAGDQETQ